jgi:ketopantoate reductase
MSSQLKYIIDDSGHKTSVLVPVKTWQELNANYLKLIKKLEVLTGIQNGMKEVREAKQKGKKLQTLKDFLREHNR